VLSGRLIGDLTRLRLHKVTAESCTPAAHSHAAGVSLEKP